MPKNCGERIVLARCVKPQGDYLQTDFHNILNNVRIPFDKVKILGDGAVFRCKCTKIIGYFEYINRIYPKYTTIELESKALVKLRCK